MSDMSICCWTNGIRANNMHFSIQCVSWCPCSAQSCFKLMGICQRTSESGKAVCGPLVQPSIRTTHPNQPCLPPPPPCAPAANASGLVQPNCINPKPYTHVQVNGSVQSGTKRAARPDDGKVAHFKKEEANCRISRCATHISFSVCIRTEVFEKKKHWTLYNIFF